MSGSYAQGPQSAGNTATASRDIGYSVYASTVVVQAAGGATADFVNYIPEGARVIDVYLDSPTAHTSGTATISGGSTVGGTDYFSATDVKTNARAKPTFTAAQVTLLQSLAHVSGQSDVAVNLRLALGATITSVGTTNVTILYTLERSL